jgi:hypothetical protein
MRTNKGWSCNWLARRFCIVMVLIDTPTFGLIRGRPCFGLQCQMPMPLPLDDDGVGQFQRYLFVTLV